MILIFILGSFIPPFMLVIGEFEIAEFIYSIYAPLCHQLAYRSFFLFGEQSFYPRELANIHGYQTYEDVTGMSPSDIEYARKFYGDERIGYKIALCQRDIAIYSAMLIFVLVQMLSRNKILSIPAWIWFLFGLFPVMIDGGTQLFSLFDLGKSWLPIRESNPHLRIVTGSLFGFLTVWFILPKMHKFIK